MVDRHTKVTRLIHGKVGAGVDKTALDFKKVIAVVVVIWHMKAARAFVIIFGSTLCLWCYRQ